MRREGRIEIGPYGADSKSAREHQAFLVTPDGERLLLRRWDGPSMRDEALEAMAGRHVVADGLLRGGVFIAKAVSAVEDPTARAPGRAPSASRGTSKRSR